LKTAILLPCFVPPHPELLDLVQRLEALNGWGVLRARLPRPHVYNDLLARAACGGYERLVWLHPKLDATVEQIDALVQVHETTGAKTVCGVVPSYDSAVIGLFAANFTPSHSGQLTISGDSSGVVECTECTLDLAVTELAETPKDLTERDVLLDARILCGLWVERPFYPQDARNGEEA